MKIAANKLEQIKWGLILLLIGTVVLSLVFTLMHFRDSPMPAHLVGIGVGAVLMGLLALCCKVVFHSEKEILQKRFIVLGVRVAGVKIKVPDISSAKAISPTDILIRTRSGESFTFDNFHPKDAIGFLEDVKAKMR